MGETSKDERINLRLKHSAKQMLERAASIEGKTVSKYVLASALASAENTIHEHEMMSLGIREAEVFYNALAAPLAPNEKLADAFEEYSQRITRK